jgi:hypothetical protein
MRFPLRLLVLALLASLGLCATGLAAAPPAKEGADENPIAKTAMQAASAAANIGQTLGTISKHNQATAAAVAQAGQVMPAIGNGAGTPATPAPAPKPGGGKVIYGDIIIHK